MRLDLTNRDPHFTRKQVVLKIYIFQGRELCSDYLRIAALKFEAFKPFIASALPTPIRSVSQLGPLSHSSAHRSGRLDFDSLSATSIPLLLVKPRAPTTNPRNLLNFDAHGINLRDFLDSRFIH